MQGSHSYNLGAAFADCTRAPSLLSLAGCIWTPPRSQKVWLRSRVPFCATARGELAYWDFFGGVIKRGLALAFVAGVVIFGGADGHMLRPLGARALLERKRRELGE